MTTQKSEGPVEIPELLAILPLLNSVLFPGSIIPIDVGRKKSVRLVEEAISKERPVIGILTQREARTEDPDDSDLYTVGCAARILKVIKLAKDNFSVILQGVSRFRMVEYSQHDPFIVSRVQPVPDLLKPDVELDALVLNLKDIAKRVVKLMPELPKEAAALVDSVSEPGQLADLITSNLDLSVEEKQEVLETFDLKERLRKVLAFLSRQLEVLKVREKINTQVQDEMGRNQREYVLRQQLKAIKEELGELDDTTGDIEEFKTKIAEIQMPEEAQKVALKQLDRLKVMQPSSAEYTVTRTYLEWLTDTPWAERTDDNLDIENVRKVLDEDHYDLDKVKKRVVEYIAVRKLKPDKKGPILCLVGPPGVGKTSLGRSIARAIGRKFVRVSLGGVRDEAEIRGHRRTYVGSLPGRIIQSMKKAGTVNPVFMLDEIDKLGHDFRGDPASALLEVLDPEQNNSFSDHYLEVNYDLSHVMFIATANILDPVPPALRDRLEILELPGYTRDEKLAIAKQFLIPKQLEEHGLTDEQFEFDPAAVSEIIESYTREAGVRNLEREMANVIRGFAVKVAEGSAGDERRRIMREEVSVFLGPQKFISEVAARRAEPGVATGLAWTPVGGDIIFVEATIMSGKGNLVLTGQLGDVMKESAQAALSYVRSRATDLGIAENFLEKHDIHVHIPAGGIPKDGPSAGVTLFIALVSLLKGKGVPPDVALSGEITLRGTVLPVGGVKEKVLAAHRAGIKKIILPERNEKDLIDVPAQAREELEFHFVRRMDEVLALVSPELVTSPSDVSPLDLDGGTEPSDSETSTEDQGNAAPGGGDSPVEVGAEVIAHEAESSGAADSEASPAG
ncbi:MAG: endopeptidase La [Deltaproteobacteria bacterium]|nr:endopeptidase La [Deltaproteobacteria bacterium]